MDVFQAMDLLNVGVRDLRADSDGFSNAFYGPQRFYFSKGLSYYDHWLLLSSNGADTRIPMLSDTVIFGVGVYPDDYNGK